jgi:hypothetical protein
MKLVPYTHTRPIQFRDVEGGFGKEVIPQHPVRRARLWEMAESWWQEEDESEAGPERDSD